MPGKLLFMAEYTNRIIGAKTNARLNDTNYTIKYYDSEFIEAVSGGGFQVYESMYVWSTHTMLWTAVDNANAVSHIGWGPPDGATTYAGVTGRCSNYHTVTSTTYNLLTPYGVNGSLNYFFKIRNEGAASNTTLGFYYVSIFYCNPASV